MKTARVGIEADWESLASELSAAECERLRGMRDRSAARQSAHAWVALKALARRDTEVWHDEHGRPQLRGVRAWVGIAHKPRFAFVALSEVAVGIDVEDLDQPLTLDAFLEGSCDVEEKRLVDVLAGATMSAREMAIVFWSLKEAACKWAGRPLIPRQCRIRSLTENGRARIEFADGARAPELSWRIVDRHVFCVAAETVEAGVMPAVIRPVGGESVACGARGADLRRHAGGRHVVDHDNET